MKTSTLIPTKKFARSTGLAASAIVLALGLAACGSDSDGAADDATPTQASTPAMTETPSETPMTDAGAQAFGPACSAIPTSGAGSFSGMVKDPVATAASNNPLLSTLVTAVTEADLGETLNTAEALTVFAPTNDAFAKLPKETLDKVLADKELLTKILTYHVVGGQLDPKEVVGTQETLQKGTVEVAGDTDGMTVNGAAVLCGNIPTANATVYVIDTVLMPADM